MRDLDPEFHPAGHGSSPRRTLLPFSLFFQGALGTGDSSNLRAAPLCNVLTCRERHPASSTTHSTDIPLLPARHCSQLWGPSGEQSRQPPGSSQAPLWRSQGPDFPQKHRSHQASPGPDRAHPSPGASLRLMLTPFSARRGDWLLSFVYRTSSVQLRVAGLQPVELQDKRMENVDLSSVVSTARPSRGAGFPVGPIHYCSSASPAHGAQPQPTSPRGGGSERAWEAVTPT